MYSMFYSLATKKTDTCNKIISLVNENWNSSENQLSESAQVYIQELLKYDDEDFDSICLVDDDRNVIKVFGNNVPPDSFYDEFSKKKFYTEGVYFKEDYIDSVTFYYDDKTDEKEKEILEAPYDENSEDYYEESKSLGYIYAFSAMSNRRSFPIFKRLFIGRHDEKLSSKEYYDWAKENKVKESLWIMYKTNYEGVNVAINKVQIETAIEKAIYESNIGLTPNNNGEVIILNIPPLT